MAPAGPEFDHLQADAKSFMDRFSGTTVVVTNGGQGAAGDVYDQKMPELLSSNQADVAWVQHQNSFPSVVKSGVLEPVDDVWNDPTLGLTTGFPAAYKSLWTDADGHQHGVPIDVVVLPQIYYNKAHFAKAGVQPPSNGTFYTSNEELFAAIDKLKASGFYGMTLCGNNPLWFNHQMSGLANNLLTPDQVVGLWKSADQGTAPIITWDDPEVVHIFELQAEYLKRNIYVEGLLGRDYAGSFAQFATGKASLLSDGSWATGALMQQAPDIDVGCMLYPQQRPDITPVFCPTAVNGLTMSSTAPNKPLAKAFLSWAITKERQEALATAGTLQPARVDVSSEALAGLGKVTAEMIAKFSTVGLGTWWQDYTPLPVSEVVDNGLSGLTTGTTTPQQIGDAAEKAASALRNA